jgi:DNA-directed RNA polymerase beta' subunit
MNELDKELNNLTQTREIKSIQFGLFSPDEIRKSSVCEVTKADTFDASEPVINGLFDPRMGVIERGPECATCENNHTMCPGHFGHIELTLPVFHLHLLQDYVMKLLPCICFRCSSLLVDKENNKKLLRELKGKKGEKRFKIINKASKRTQKTSLCCHNEGCRVIQPMKYTMLTSDKIRSIEKKIPGLETHVVVAIIAEFSDEAIKDITLPKKHRITPEHCYEIFRKITDADCKFLGFNPVFSRPEWMICTVLPVPPPSVRPSVQRDNNQRSEDDLTYVLLMIIKANIQLRKRIENEDEQRKIDVSYELLQWNVATLISNKIAGIVKNVQRSGKVIKSLTERIRGKHGRLRGNLLGKRVDQSARTVIGPDPLISIEEYGVPEKIAMINTFPDVVTEDNIEELRQIVRNGPNVHPGAKKIQRLEYDCFGNPSPCMINLKHIDPSSVKLKVGDIVHRHLKNGDISLFNRQPSLHRMSMMAHKIVIVKGNTFRLNVFVCLSGDTVINTDMGSTTIADFKNYWKTHKIKSSDWNSGKNVYDCSVNKFHEIVPKDLGFKSYEIILENGDKIKATQEHPFYTKESNRIEAKDLKVGDYLVGYEEDLPPIDYKTGITILSEIDVKKVIPLKTNSNNVIKYLKKLNLIDIKCNDKKQIILAGLLGHLFGDGTLWWNDKNVHLTFRSENHKDISSIQKDLISLGFDEKIVKIHEKRKCNNREIKQIDGTVLSFNSNGIFTIDIRRRPIAMMFKALGMPNGDRVTQEFGIPYWIMNGSAMVKRQFLKGYFGTDCSGPKVDNRTGYRFKNICFKMSKIEGKSPVKFFEEICSILNDFGISTLPISVSSGNIRKNGDHTFSYRGTLKSDIKNMQQFCQKIGYLYKKERQKEAMYIAEYCKYINRLNPCNKGRKGYVNVLKYTDWCNQYTIKDTGLVWKRISAINEISLEKAYDITTCDDNHNFISSRILSKNCHPYNADFDGDEMNTFLPQSLQTRVELQEIAGVSKQIISPAKSTPIISVAQDSMVGSYLLTKSDFATSGEKLFQYIMPNIQLKTGFNIFEERKKEKITGKELYSYILPNVSLKNIKYDEKVYQKGVEIKNGNIIDGLMAKGTLSGGSNGIIQAINNQFGPKVCRDFLDNLQRLVVCWLDDVGFTVGFGDSIPKNDIKDDIEKILSEKRKESDELIRKAQIGLYEPYLSNELKMKKLELEIGNIGRSSTQEVENIVMNNLSKKNNFMISVKSGSKGNAGNLNQIMGTVGQRLIDGERISYGLTGRTTSHFTMYDIGLSSRGYVYNSYMNGMTPQEFYMTTMNARMDAISSNIKTAQTGYMQRKLIKAMEDLKVEYDGTVRDACGNIVQITYGEDGLDSVKLEHIPLRLINKSDKQMENDYLIEVDDFTKAFVKKETWDKIQKDRKDNEKLLDEEWKYLTAERKNLRYKYFKNSLEKVEKYLSPVNFERMIHQVKNQFHVKKYNLSDLTPADVIKLTDDLINYINKYNVNCDYSPVLKIMIKSHLSAKQCIYKYRLPNTILKHIVRLIKHKILHSIINPGEMVGIVAAQSIGEPLTQLVLKSYHQSGGLSNQSVVTTGGIPRMQEIINTATNIKTPSMTIYLKQEYCESKEIAFEVKNQLEYTELKDLLISSEILYLPEKEKGKFNEEEDEYKIYKEIAELTEIQCPSQEDLSNWVLWMEFDREAMLRKNIYLNDIYEEIIRNCNVDTEIECVVSNMNGNHLTLRIRVAKSLDEDEGYIPFFKHIGDNLLNLPLRGIEGIKSIDVLSNNKIFYNPDGSVESKKEWYLKTFGSNLISIMSNKYVDTIRTTTNDINEIYNLYGIEGARTAIIREIKLNIKEGAGADINNRHYCVLADLMTHRGKMMCISRHGFGSSPFMSPLGKASYETMDKILISSGVFASLDNMNGTSSNIIAGQSVRAGTNSFELHINKNLLPEPKLNTSDNLYPPEQNVNELPETNFSPSFAPMDSNTDNLNSDIDNAFIKKMAESKEVKLEDYMKVINSQSSIIDDSNFDFGYNINNITNIKSNNIKNININIVKN